MSIVVDAPIERVWARVGKYCDIGEWAFQGCELLSGKEGELGAVRTTGHSVIVGQTRYSYTYTQPLRISGLYPMYHGTLEARPVGSSHTTLYYTPVWDSPRSRTTLRGTSRLTPTAPSSRRCCET